MKQSPRATFTPEEVAALAKAAKLPLDGARDHGALIAQVGGLLGLLDRLDDVALGETAPAFAYDAKPIGPALEVETDA